MLLYELHCALNLPLRAVDLEDVDGVHLGRDNGGAAHLHDALNGAALLPHHQADEPRGQVQVQHAPVALAVVAGTLKERLRVGNLLLEDALLCLLHILPAATYLKDRVLSVYRRFDVRLRFRANLADLGACVVEGENVRMQ